MKVRNAIVTHQKLHVDKELAALAADLLFTAERLWEKGTTLDTSVRDTLADGIARLVYVAYDCEAVNGANFHFPELNPDDAFNAHREWSTEKWFRDRGFSDWYAKGAATLFHTMVLPIFHRRKALKKKVAA